MVEVVRKGLESAVTALPSAVGVLAVCTIADRSFCDAVFLLILDQGLPVAHRLCYLIHGKQDTACLYSYSHGGKGSIL